MESEVSVAEHECSCVCLHVDSDSDVTAVLSDRAETRVRLSVSE